MIKNINEVHLLGRVGADPYKKAFGERTCCRFNVVTNESFKNKAGDWVEDSQWHSVVVWTSKPENIAFIKKGVLMDIVGKITYRTYVGKDGLDRTATEVTAFRYQQSTDNIQPQEQEQEQFNEPQEIVQGDLPF